MFSDIKITFEMPIEYDNSFYQNILSYIDGIRYKNKKNIFEFINRHEPIKKGKGSYSNFTIELDFQDSSFLLDQPDKMSIFRSQFKNTLNEICKLNLITSAKTKDEMERVDDFSISIQWI